MSEIEKQLLAEIWEEINKRQKLISELKASVVVAQDISNRLNNVLNNK